MNILITTIFEYPHEGGLSTHVSTLKKGLEERNHKVDVLSFTDMNPFARKLFTQAPGFLMNKVKKGKGQLLNDRQKMKMLKSYIDKVKADYDVINSQDVYAALASIESGVTTVATVHGYFSYEAISRGAIMKGSPEDLEIVKTEQQAYKNAAKVIAVDKRIKEYIKQQSNVGAYTIKNFINVNEFQVDKSKAAHVKAEFNIPDDVKILFVPRRLTEKNGVVYPTLALPKVLGKHPHTLLIYAGTGEQYSAIEQKTMELQLQENVKLLGSIPHEKMKDLYSIADIVLVPSIHSHGVEEATSISALEAMGSGAPVIAGAVGGLKEIFEHEKDGLLVQEKNTDALSNSIIRILDDPLFGNRLAENARTKVENNYSHLSAAEKYEKVYREALELR
ncbi:glycosyltransferase family 4 protein [Bacillus sp. V3B]|uniref:glycosyltransferase family 4 protein n=1 Tax=Bacillus sp. V3B TaxID=2804915 RepID=UPI002109C26B|nr:glycosyltransferase family 4 protein [Bacillus sp. V3B]MCQ6276841.1 glycosyltransferase family 4 protein [Bacillus sp. V3B]